MKNRFKNILLKIQSTFSLLNVRNIRLFFFSLKNESIGNTVSKVIGVFKRNRSIAYDELTSCNDSHPVKAYCSIDCCCFDNDHILILGWIHSIHYKINKLEIDHTKDYEVLWIDRPELQKSKIFQVENASPPGFVIKLNRDLMTGSDLELTFHSDKHSWAVNLNIDDLAGSHEDNILKHFVKQFSRENFSTKQNCSSISTPLISLVTPVYNTDKNVLDQTIKSVLNQNYENWEWCIYDDGSSSIETIKTLDQLKSRDSRINIERGTNLGMVNAYNKVISMANGDWIAVLDHDDTLSVNALCSIAESIDQKPGVKFLYSDEDLINTDGYFELPTKKGAFSVKKILRYNYINHLMVIKKELGDSLDWFKPEFKGAQDYDLILRIMDQISNEEIFYIDQVLYHWRQVDSSINYDYSRKDYVLESGRKSLQKYYDRNGKKGLVIRAKKLGYYDFIPDP